MAILLTKTTKVVVQGITGREGSMRAKFMRRLGTNVVAGVTPGRGGEEVDGIPVYNTVKDAVKNHGLFDVSVTFIPGTGLKDAVFEALDADIKWIVMPVERVPLYDILEMVAYGKTERRDAPGARLHRREHPGDRRPRVVGRFGRIRQQAFRTGPCRGHLPQRRAVGDPSLRDHPGGIRHQYRPSCRHGAGDRHVLLRRPPPVSGGSRYGCHGDLRRDGRVPRGRGGAAGEVGKVHQADHHLRFRRLGPRGDEVLPCERDRRARQRVHSGQDHKAQGGGHHRGGQPQRDSGKAS